MQARVVGEILARGAVFAAAAACAHGPGTRASPDAIEAAYVEARLAARATAGGCRAGDRACCGERARAGREATAAGDEARSVRLWHDVALACPERRDEAAAAAPPPAAPSGAGAPARPRNVTYAVRLPPDVRLFWISTAIDRRLAPGAGPPGPAAPRTVEVEAHAIRFRRGRPGPLFVVERRLELPALPAGDDGIVTIELFEADDAAGPPIEIRARVDRPPPPPRRPAAPPPAPPKRAPRLERARPVALAPLRTPPELGAALRRAPAIRLCLDREGALDTVRFLEPVHPRLAAAVVDQRRDARHEPYRVDDLAVPSCEVVTAGGR